MAGESVLGDFTDCFAVFGAVVASYLTLKVVLSLWDGIQSYVLAESLGLVANLKKTGQWAVVTGATDGIGKAYAQELAKKGMDIVLISRNPEKLADVASEIHTQYKVQTKCVTIDFSGGPEIYRSIQSQIRTLDIGVLVNNVGIAYTHPEYYTNLEEETIRDMMNINMTSVAQVTSIVLPGMCERRRGVIINISSGSALVPTPMLTLYSAAKSFVDVFSQALQTECKSKGIIVQCVMPFFVATKLSKIRRANLMVPTPSSYVKSAISTVGLQGRTFGCISHAIQAYVYSRIPPWLYGYMSLRQLIATRKRALMKKEREEKGH